MAGMDGVQAVPEWQLLLATLLKSKWGRRIEKLLQLRPLYGG